MPPKKRARKEEVVADTAESNDSVERDEDFWLDDGNIVLIAEDKAFRVHQSVLSRNSDFFRDLFAVPQPADEEKFADCPVVQLSECSTDVQYLLHALYNGIEYVKPDKILKFSVVAALIRLSHKYQIDALRDGAVARLRTCFTTDFQEWRGVMEQTPHCSESMSFDKLDAITAVNLARLTGTHSILPAALYLCCQLDANDLINGVQNTDGTWECLTPDDLVRCITGRSSLITRNTGIITHMLQPVSNKECTDPSRCPRVQAGLLVSMQGTNVPAYETQNALQRFTEVLAVMEKQSIRWSRLCRSCRVLLCTREYHERLKTWYDLPTLMGVEVPEWPEPEESSDSE